MTQLNKYLIKGESQREMFADFSLQNFTVCDSVKFETEILRFQFFEFFLRLNFSTCQLETDRRSFRNFL